MKKSGNLVEDGSNDILSQALGTPEHSGRLRGIGHFVKPTVYFNIPRRSNTSEQTKQLMLELSKQAKQIQMLQDQLHALKGGPDDRSLQEEASETSRQPANKDSFHSDVEKEGIGDSETLHANFLFRKNIILTLY